MFPENQLGEIKRKAECIIELKGHLAAQYAPFFCGHIFLQQFDACLQGTQERFLLLLHHFPDQRLLGNELGIGVAHHFNQRGNKAMHKCFMHSQEGVAIAYGPAENATDHVACLGIRWQLTVGNRKSDGAQVVGNNPHGDVFFGNVAVPGVADLSNLLDDRLKQVCVVVRQFTLHGHAETLESHASIDNLCGKRLQRAVGFAVILHEDQVPYLDDLRVTLVHQGKSIHCCPFAVGPYVDVYL